MRVVDREAKERLIINAAIEAFSKRGYEKTSISDISRRADIATGGVYNYFDNKETLFTSCCKLVFREFLDGIKQASQVKSERGGDSVFQVVYYTLRFFRNNPAYARIVLLEAKEFIIRFPETDILSLWHNTIGSYLQERLEQLLPGVQEKMDSRFYVSLMLGGVESIIVLWLFQPEALNMTEREIAKKLSLIIRKTVED